MQFLGEIRQQEMLRTFNCGIGAILICSAENLDRAMDLLKDEKPVVIGALQSCTGPNIFQLSIFQTHVLYLTFISTNFEFETYFKV